MEESAKGMLGDKRRKSTLGIPVKTEVLFGKPADKILEYAQEERIDLIVIRNVGAGTKLSKVILPLAAYQGP